MKKQFLLFVVALLLPFSVAHANVKIGEPAPDFSLMGADGKEYTLKDLRGKIVVLEWFNHECPFVRKHYDVDNMQTLQKTYADKGVIWLSVISSAAGKQGNVSAEEALKNKEADKAHPTAILLDTTGEVGKAYSAKTTPHMFVISAAGNVAYMGAIDNIPSAKKEDVAKAKNFVATALDELLAGNSVTTSVTTPYGCSVKYAD